MVHKTSFHANTLPFRLATFPCLLAFVSAWITCGRAASQNPPVVRQPHEEMIIYTRGARPNWDVFLIEEEGAAPIRLTDHASLDYGATFSPDAKWVVFTSEREGSADLYAIELEGRRVVRLTRHEAMEDASAFAPDGKSIAFVSNREGNADIFVMPFEPDNPDAESRAVNLTQSRESEFNPAFSPDGRRIAFACASSYTESIGSSICVMNADGSELRHLVWTGDRPLQYGSPVWSADGTRLYFYSGSLDGRHPRRP